MHSISESEFFREMIHVLRIMCWFRMPFFSKDSSLFFENLGSDQERLQEILHSPNFWLLLFHHQFLIFLLIVYGWFTENYDFSLICVDSQSMAFKKVNQFSEIFFEILNWLVLIWMGWIYHCIISILYKLTIVRNRFSHTIDANIEEKRTQYSALWNTSK